MQIPEKKNKKFHHTNRNSVRTIVVVFFLVHLAFLATGFIPDKSKYTCSAFRTPQNLSGYKTISLIRWDYAPGENVMELVFDLKDTAYSAGKIEFTAIYNNAKNLESQIVYSDKDMLILQLYMIPKQSGKKINITFEYTPDGEQTSEISFYSYTGIIHEVDSLPVLSQKEYYIARQDYDIAYYQSLIKDLEDSISKNDDSIKNIQADITRLKSNVEMLTADEMLNRSENIENNENTIKALQLQNESSRKKIAEHQEVIKVLEERKAKYE